jgi:hypothetical protein
VESRSWILLLPDRRSSGSQDGAIRRSFVAGCSTWSSPAARVVAVARDLALSAQSIYTSRRQDRINRGLVPGLTSAEKAELVAAKRRTAELETEPAVHRWATVKGASSASRLRAGESTRIRRTDVDGRQRQAAVTTCRMTAKATLYTAMALGRLEQERRRGPHPAGPTSCLVTAETLKLHPSPGRVLPVAAVGVSSPVLTWRMARCSWAMCLVVRHACVLTMRLCEHVGEPSG